MIGSELFREVLSRPCGAPTVTAALSRPKPGITVCTVTGAVNPDTTPILRKALAEGWQDDNTLLVIDLSAVTSLDSVGLYTLLEARHKHRINGGGHLAVVVAANSQAIPELYIFVLQATFDLHYKLTEPSTPAPNTPIGMPAPGQTAPPAPRRRRRLHQTIALHAVIIAILVGGPAPLGIAPAGEDSLSYLALLTVFGLTLVAARTATVSASLWTCIGTHLAFLTVNRVVLSGQQRGAGWSAELTTPNAVLLIPAYLAVATLIYLTITHRLRPHQK